MRDILEKLTKVEEVDSLTTDEFNYDTELSLYIDDLADGEESSAPENVNLTYSIYTEWRSWGLKDISIVLKGKVTFEVEILDADDRVIDTISVSVDSDDVKIVWVSGAGYVPESFIVRVDRTGKLIDADLNFYFQDHS